jgi:hypothetical protein
MAKKASDIQKETHIRRATDVQTEEFRRIPLRVGSDTQRVLSKGVHRLLVERQESLARVHEAAAELALAKGAIARIDARLLDAGYFPPDNE